MSQDDTLRLTAQVVDQFSGPLRNLRSQLAGMREAAVPAATAMKAGMVEVDLATNRATGRVVQLRAVLVALRADAAPATRASTLR